MRIDGRSYPCLTIRTGVYHIDTRWRGRRYKFSLRTRSTARAVSEWLRFEEDRGTYLQRWEREQNQKNLSLAGWIQVHLKEIEITDAWGTHSARKAALGSLGRSLGHLSVRDATQDDILEWIDGLRHLGKAPATINHHKAYASKCFSDAIQAPHRYASHNPCERIPSERGMGRRRAELTDAERGAVIQASPTWFKPLLLFLIGSGCRLGEAVNALWVDVHLGTAPWIRFRHTKSRKGEDRHRDVPLLEEAVEGINLVRQVRRLRCPYVFTDPFNEPFPVGWRETLSAVGIPASALRYRRGHGGHIDSAWNVIIEAVDLSDYYRRGNSNFTPHCLRHDHATRLAEAGVDEGERGDIQGNRTQQHIYTHRRLEHLSKKLEKVGQAEPHRNSHHQGS